MSKLRKRPERKIVTDKRVIKRRKQWTTRGAMVSPDNSVTIIYQKSTIVKKSKKVALNNST